jgi:hypothetical protein
MKTYIIIDATAGAIAYRIEQLVATGNTVVNVITVKDDAVILFNSITHEQRNN